MFFFFFNLYFIKLQTKIDFVFKEWHKFKLSDEQIATFNRDGYLLGIPVLTEHQVDRLLQVHIKRREDEEERGIGEGGTEYKRKSNKK